MAKRKKKVKDKLATGGETPQLVPLILYMVGCATQEEMNSNVTATIKRGYEPITSHVHKYDGECSIVGAGPSIENTYQELTGDVLAINSAIGYLLDKDIVPRWAMIWDAADICEQFAVPHPDVTYLIGSRCHPKVFERLKDCKIIVWHAGGDHNINDFMCENGMTSEPMVNGGSAGVTRAMYLAVSLGYRDLHLFGADSCYNGNKTHVNGSLVKEKDIFVSVGNNPPMFFRTTPEWCSQVNEFRDIYSIFRHPQCNVGITVHGDGMLPYMANLMKQKDEQGLLWLEDGTPHPSNVPTDYSQPLEENPDAVISK